MSQNFNLALHAARSHAVPVGEMPPQRRRTHRAPGSTPAPRAFESMFHRDALHSAGLAWTAADFAIAFSCTLAIAAAHAVILALLAASTTAALSRVLKLHDLRPNRTWIAQQGLILLTAALAALSISGIAPLIGLASLHTESLALEIMLTSAGMSIARSLWRRRIARHFKSGVATLNFIIAGADAAGREVRDYLASLDYLGYRFKGFIQLSGTPDPKIPAEDLLGAIADIIPISKSIFVDEIIFSHRPETGILIATLDGARTAGIDVRLIPSVSETLQGRNDVHYVGNLPTIVLHQRHTRAASLFVKRILDVIAAALGLIATLPITIAVAVAIRLDSAGPLFYGSDRVGFKGRVFPCYKFRTMVSDADHCRAAIEHLNERQGILFKISNDPRITRAGKFLRKYSLDELPQLWNVLRGDMSMVGPRPPILSEVAQYEIDHLRRLEVTPGITGLWQVEARHKPSFDNYIELDRAYVRNWSLGLDLSILLRTVKVVLMGTGT
jgi:exopolysaccharide biosynthesis polyprenyl glycosylphosphotransferase